MSRNTFSNVILSRSSAEAKNLVFRLQMISSLENEILRPSDWLSASQTYSG
jgi:hypothetical protein